MSEPAPRQPDAAPLVPAGESSVSREIPFSLIWLHAVDPRIFDPVTWEHGRYTTIRLTSPDGSVDVSVYRAISHYLDGNTGLQDEIHSHHENEGSQFNYEFGPAPDRQLIEYNPTPSMTDRMQQVVRDLSGLVGISGSTIEARNWDRGPEASFVSDGVQWINRTTGEPAVSLPAITIGPPSLETPAS